MTTYSFPTSRELTEIGQDFLGPMTLNDPIFRYFPVRNVDSHLLEWEQRDNYKGLQQVRGLNGEPGRVNAIGGKRYRMEPGVYGEHIDLREDELTTRRAWGDQMERPIDLTPPVTEKTEQLVTREVARMRQILWTLVATGTFSVANEHGAVVHTDSYTTQTYSTTTPWATASGAAPVFDFQEVALKARGHGVSFGASAKAFMNRTTANNLLRNTNAADLGGMRTLNGPFSLPMANSIFVAQDVPTVEVFDDFYIDDADATQLFLPNGKVVVFGQRPNGEPIGEFRRTRNANNPGFAPGPYDEVYVNPKPPKNVEVHRGQNGGPVMFWPSAIVVMDVTAGS